MSEADATGLAEDLRRSAGDFVRAIRHDTGTERSAQSDTLDLLHRHGPMNVAALAERRGVTHQTMRMVVAQLAASGLVRQEPDPQDRRSKLVSVEPAGREAIVQEQKARSSRIADAIVTRLSRQEHEVLRAAVPILARLADGTNR